MSTEDTIEITISQNKTYVDPIPLINFDNECKQIEEKLKHDKEDGNFDKTTTIEVSSELDDENIKKVVKYFIRGTDIVKQTRRVKVTKKHNKVSTMENQKRIDERKKWPKFGDAKKGNEGVTIVKGDVFILRPDGKTLFGTDVTDRKSPFTNLPKIMIKTSDKPKAWKSRRVLSRNDDPTKTIDTSANFFRPKSRNDDNDRTLFVSGISMDTTYESLSDLFNTYGKVKHIKLLEGRGIAFIKYYNIQTAEKALEADGSGLDHMRIRVKFANNK